MTRARMRKSTLSLGIIGAATLMLAACGNGDTNTDDQSAGDDGEIVSLTAGLMPIVDVAPVFVGIEEGIFTDHGFDIETEIASGGAAIIPAVTGGTYEVGFSNNVSLIIGNSTGLDLEMIAPGVGISEETSEDVGYCNIMAHPDSGISEPTDLEGMSIAVNTLNNIGDITISYGLEQNGADADSVNFVEMPFPDMPAALMEERIEAVWICEPFVTILLDDGAVPVMDQYAAAHPNLTVASYFAHGPWAAENTEVLARFTTALEESFEFASNNPDAVREAVTDYAGIEQDVADRMRLPDFPAEFNEESLQLLIDQSEAAGLLDEPVTIEDVILSQD